MTGLVWESPVYGVGRVGYLPLQVSGRAKIATIYYGVGRNDPKPWKLRTELPGWTTERCFESVEQAQAAMDRILERFVATVTAALEASKA